jgi:hypothetical protein
VDGDERFDELVAIAHSVLPCCENDDGRQTADVS